MTFLRRFGVLILAVTALATAGSARAAEEVAAATSASDSDSAATLSTTAAPPAPTRPRMGWFGVGVRLGVAETHLTPSAGIVNSVNQASGGSFNGDDFAVSSSSRSVTPTLHLGGDGYFFKLDLPFTFASEYRTYGIGLYPINYGIYFDRSALFPYLSLGAVGNIVQSQTTSDPDTSNKIIGALVQGRGALGLKYFPAHALALSVEAGYSPFAAGIMLLPPAANQDQTRPRGGYGSVFDLSLGAEWL